MLEAQEQGLIGRRNILKMDEEVNNYMIRYLRKDGLRFKYSMPEQIEAKALGERHLFHLPAPTCPMIPSAAR